MNKKYDKVFSFQDNFPIVAMVKNGKWGIFDKTTGNEICPPIYDDAYNGIAMIKDGEWTFINSNGKKIANKDILIKGGKEKTKGKEICPSIYGESYYDDKRREFEWKIL